MNFLSKKCLSIVLAGAMVFSMTDVQAMAPTIVGVSKAVSIGLGTALCQQGKWIEGLAQFVVFDPATIGIQKEIF